jgi:hypothetical protein
MADAKETKDTKDTAVRKDEPRKEPPLAPERYVPAAEARFSTSAEFTFPQVSYIPAAGTPLEHLMRPEYWANVKQLKAGCRIWVFAEDESYWAELLVRRVGQGYAKVQTLRSGRLDEGGEAPQLADGYDIQFRGPVVKHRIVRMKDGHVLKSGLDSYEDAAAWLRDHKRMLAA